MGELIVITKLAHFIITAVVIINSPTFQNLVVAQHLVSQFSCLKTLAFAVVVFVFAKASGNRLLHCISHSGLPGVPER